jgi:hypothetical protein
LRAILVWRIDLAQLPALERGGEIDVRRRAAVMGGMTRDLGLRRASELGPANAPLRGNLFSRISDD